MDDDAEVVDIDPGDHSPDEAEEAPTPHGYDALFFIVATLAAIGFIVAPYFFKG